MSHPKNFGFSHRLRVRWGECDMQGIVFNPHYMAYVDVALTEYWRTIGLAYPAAFLADGTDIFMVAANQRYRDAAGFDDALDVCIRIAYLGTTSFRLEFEIRRSSAVLVDGAATFVVGDHTTRQPRPLSAGLLQLVSKFEPTPPDRKSPMF